MANRKATLIRLCKTEVGWRRYPVVLGKNGRVKPGAVLVGGVERVYPEGRYQLRTYEGSKMVYRDAGEHAGDAQVERTRVENLLSAKESAQAAGVVLPITETPRVTLKKALGEFVQATIDRGSLEAAEVYRTASLEFLSVTGRMYADEITSSDISKHQGALRKRGLSDRTVANRHERVMAFLRSLNLNTKALAPSKPRYEEALPEVYSPDELRQLFESLEGRPPSMAFELLQKTGMREQEAIHLAWTSVDFARRVIRVRSNPEYGFKVKDKEQRDIPVPPDLLQKLRDHREAGSGKLVIGTAGDKPNYKLLRALKRAAKQAGLNCGNCDACLERGECERWFLHKFRATYITKMLRTGLDLRTVMKLSGHSDLESVMRYLSPADDDAIQSHVAQVVWH